MTIIVLETQQTHQNRRSKQWNQNKDRSHQSEIKPIKPIWKNQNRSTHQNHMKPKPNQTHEIHMKPKPNQTHQTDLPIKLTADQPIKPIADQPIHHHWVPKSNPSNPLPINPSNPPPINPFTTTEFPNQETKTLVLHKTKLHGRKREEAPPRAYWREREIDVYWERSKKKKATGEGVK